MKARIAAAVVLLVLAIALPLVAVSSRGAPWGYRGHQAVLLEATGTVETAVSEARRAREGRDNAAVPPVPGLFLDAGDEIRVGRYSEARLRLPAGEVTIRDGARVVLGAGTPAQPALVVARGLVEVSTPPDAPTAPPFEVAVDGLDASLVLRSGGTGSGTMRLVVDGHGARAQVLQGSVEGRATGGDAHAEAGKALVVGADKKPRVEDAPAALPMQATCTGTKLVVDVADGTQVFAGGAIHYPQAGRIEAVVAARPEVAVFARDVAGNVAFANVPCEPDKHGKAK